MSKVVSRMKDLGQKAMALKAALDKAPETVEGLRQTLAATKDQVQLLRTEAQEAVTDLADDTADPAEILADQNVKTLLVKAIELLPEREKLMMALYYEQDLNLREIGEVMGVSESRVCQLHTQAIARLRSQIVGELPVARKRKMGNAHHG